MVIKDQTNFGAGALFVAMGVGCSLLSIDYGFGNAGRIGSGLFPFGLGVILAALGVVLLVQSCAPGKAEDRLQRWQFRSLAVILGSVLVFALLLPNAGLMSAIVGLVIASSFAHRDFRWSIALPTALVLAAFCYLIFILGLKLQLPVWPEFD